MHLLNYSDELDMAIFCLNPGQLSWKNSIRSCQLIDVKVLARDSSIWRVGYAGPHTHGFEKYCEQIGVARFSQIFHPDNRTTTFGQLGEAVIVNDSTYYYHSMPG